MNAYYVDEDKRTLAINPFDYSRLSMHRIHWANEIIVIHDDNTFSIMKSRHLGLITKSTLKISLEELTELIHDDKLLAWFIQKYKCNGIFMNDDFLL